MSAPQRPAGARAARPGAPDAPGATAARDHRWRLDRRGRLVRSGLLLVTLLVLAVHLAGAGVRPVDTAVTAEPVDAVPSAQVAAVVVPAEVLVLPGDTLWGIATRVAPDVDRREAVAELRAANGLVDAGLVPGQRLQVPRSLLG